MYCFFLPPAGCKYWHFVNKKMSDDPIELEVLKRHEDRLIGLMQRSIHRVKLELFANGMLETDDIAEEHKIPSEMTRMQKVLMFILTRMTEESEEESRRTFYNFLSTLRQQPSWNYLRDSLCKCTFNATVKLYLCAGISQL